MHRKIAPIAVAALAFAAAPALAQKSKDTLRIAFQYPIAMVDQYNDPKPESNFLARFAYDTLVAYDEKRNVFEPLLAKSWKRVSPTTLELELRDDVKWHDGERFDADDAVYTLNWLADKNNKLRFRANWAWIAKAEKLGPYTMRVVAKRPTPFDLTRLAYQTDIFPEHIHAKLKNKSDFRRYHVGTGPYKVTLVDQSKGVVFTKWDGYNHASKAKPVSNIGRIEVIPMPDQGTQVANMIAGNVDLIRGLPIDQAEALGKRPGLAMTIVQSLSYIYMSLDAAGRSGTKMLTDQRVRRALMMAIDRDELSTVRGKPVRGTPEALCWRFQAGCGYSKTPPKYDPEAARRLLAEAGYDGSTELDIQTFASTKDYAEVAAGYLREIGVRAKVSATTFAVYRKKQRDGQLQILLSGWSAGGIPDVYSTMNFFFSPGPRDYYRDERLHALRTASHAEMDDAKRRRIVAEALDRAIEMSYVIPVAPITVPINHTDDIAVATGRFDAYGIAMSDLNWK